ncbi:MAG TPA: hypothetical protein P5114_01220 [Hyphomicrobiaceae bacterium]|nr:hypothetical protein [Hyphomicrobiaceae bacterium]
MIMRTAIVVAAALSCTACAKEKVMQPMGLGYYGQIEHQDAQLGGATPATATALKRLSGTRNPKMKQTLGGKILSAIALERITGRKPDPRRFNELH